MSLVRLDSEHDHEFKFAQRIYSDCRHFTDKAMVTLLSVPTKSLKRHDTIYEVLEAPVREFGTGILIRLDSALFLVSAAHVYEKFVGDDTRMELHHTERVKGLLLEFVDDQVRIDQASDVFVAQLPNDIAEQIPPTKGMQLSTVRINADIGGWNCALHGSPREGSCVSKDMHTIQMHQLFLWTRRFEGRVPLTANYSPDRHFLLGVDEVQRSMNDGHLAPALTSFGGMSGCGLWRVFKPEHTEGGWSLDNVHCVGIQTHRLECGAIKCARWDQIVALLEDLEPSTRNHILVDQS